jgi:hypothetical protein
VPKPPTTSGLPNRVSDCPRSDMYRPGDLRYRRHGPILIEPQDERLHLAGEILQSERAKLLEFEAEPITAAVVDRTRNADTAWRADRLEPCSHYDAVAMQVLPVENDIADVHSDPKAYAPVGRPVLIVQR